MIHVSNRRVGPGEPIFVIAEVGVNHNGDLRLAEQLVEAAAEAGADAVKFQTFRAEALVTRTAERAAYQVENTGNAGSQFEMLKALELGIEAHRHLKAKAERLGLIFLSTPFDPESLNFLVRELGVPALKLGSGELTNLVLIRRAASSGVPLILSTGMGTLDEVQIAEEEFRKAGGEQLALLHCVTSYPADPADANLRAMETIANATRVLVGYSDHCLGNAVSLAAAALGACIIEKHFTLDKTLSGPDHAASAEPEELAALVSEIRVVERALGSGVKQPTTAEREIMKVARKSLVASRDLAAGERLTPDMVVVKRPGTGIPPGLLEWALGRTIQTNIAVDTVLTWDCLGDAS